MRFRKDNSTDQRPAMQHSTKEKNAPFILPKQGIDHESSFISPRVQMKLSIGESNDKYEREADAVANKVVNDAPSVQKTSIESKDEESVQPKLQMKTDSAHGKLAGIEDQINSEKGKGSQMDHETASFMGTRFGADFNAVRIHTGAPSIQMNQELGAKAFTLGNDIHFNEGQYNPATKNGKELLAHELTHTIQQGTSRKNAHHDVSHSNNQVIQRSTSWKAGTIHETANLAHIIFGAPKTVAWEMLNGTKLTSRAKAAAAINSPVISTSKRGKLHTAKVKSVGKNVGSFDETILKPGPWKSKITRGTAHEHLGLPSCSGSASEKTNYRAKGHPNDKLFRASNKRHEDRHASDHKKAFNETIVKWDKKLTAAKAKGTTFSGSNDKIATNKLWKAMGGTPKEVAHAFSKKCGELGDAYHATAKGKPISGLGNGSNKTCTETWSLITSPA